MIFFALNSNCMMMDGMMMCGLSAARPMRYACARSSG